MVSTAMLGPWKLQKYETRLAIDEGLPNKRERLPQHLRLRAEELILLVHHADENADVSFQPEPLYAPSVSRV